MKIRMQRLISLILIVCLCQMFLPAAIIRTKALSTDMIVDAALEIIYRNEGSYGSVNRNDNGALSIGKIQWHGNRALNLLKTIVNMDRTAAQSILGAALYNEILTSADWSCRTVTSAEATALSNLISTANGKSAQDALATADVTAYIDHGKDLGIQDDAALIYFADLENQCGPGGSKRVAKAAAGNAGSYAAVGLAELHNAALSDYAAGDYPARRNRVYQYCLDYTGDELPSRTPDPQYADTLPVYAYPISTGEIPVYSADGSMISNRYIIGVTDLCIIREIYTDGWCYISYPSSVEADGYFEAYVPLTTFISSPAASLTRWRSEGSYIAFRRSDLCDKLGSVSSGDSCKVVAESGSLKQVIYPVTGAGYWKMGWIEVTGIVPPDPPVFPLPILGYNCSSDTRTTVYESTDSMGTYYGQIFVDDLCTINSVSISGNWIHVTYPTSSGDRSGYVYVDQFFPALGNISKPYDTTVTARSISYRKADMATTYGYADIGDTITVVGRDGNKYQVIYPITVGANAGKYKLAWIYGDNIAKNLVSIAVTTKPDKTVYLEGEHFSTSGMVVTAYYDDGSSAAVTNYTYSGYTSTPGAKTVTISYGGKTTVVDVTVRSKSPVALSITRQPADTSYFVGEVFDDTGMVVTAAYDNGTTADVTDYDVSYDFSAAGTKTVLVEYVYNGVNVHTTLTVVVFDHAVSGIEIVTPPVRTDYHVGDTLDTTGLTLAVSYNDGRTEIVDSGFICSPTMLNVAGIQTITVAYGDYHSAFDVTVQLNGSGNVWSYGDANGDGTVNMKDLTALRRMLASGDVILSVVNGNPDANGDGEVDLIDVIFLHRYLAGGWGVELPEFPDPEEDRPLAEDLSQYLVLTTEKSSNGVTCTSFRFGQSVLGRDLVCWSLQQGDYSRTVLLNFAIHGWEDSYAVDAQLLVDLGNALVEHYAACSDMKNCRLLIVPCANPDGVEEGTTNNGFGRCNADGIDLNRDFDASHIVYTNARNYTPAPFSGAESRALRDLVLAAKADVVIDFHGWLNFTIGNKDLAEVFSLCTDLCHKYELGTGAHGYFSYWAQLQGAEAILVEFRDTTSVILGDVIDAVDRLILNNYGSHQTDYTLDTEFEVFDSIVAFADTTGKVYTQKAVGNTGTDYGYINGASDECTILQIYDNGWCKVRYPVGALFKTGYCQLSAFIGSEAAVSHYSAHTTANAKVYTTSAMTTQLGTVWSTDVFTVVAEKSGLVQIIYPLDSGGYKMGWINASAVQQN